MEKATEITKQLDRASTQSSVDAETRAFCQMLILNGTDEQAVRAIAVLSLAGETTPQLPTTVRTGSWPNLPKREAEVRALMTLAEHERVLRSFMGTLISKAGPSEKTREKLFHEYAARQPESSILDRLAHAIDTVTEEIVRRNISPVSSRKRLLRFVTVALKKASKGKKGSDSVELTGRIPLFRSLGCLISMAPKPEPEEASSIITLLLDQLGEGMSGENFKVFKELWDTLSNLESLLRPGWAFRRLKKVDRIRREKFSNAVIAYACMADSEEDRQLARSLLFLTLPDDVSSFDWPTETRARLAMMQAAKGESDGFAQLAQTLHEITFQLPANLAQLQDISGGALYELNRLFRGWDIEVRCLRMEIEHLESEETVRARAGDIIRDGVKRQLELMGSFGEYAREKRQDIVRRLREALQNVRANPSATSLSEVENAILDAIALLEEPK